MIQLLLGCKGTQCDFLTIGKPNVRYGFVKLTVMLSRRQEGEEVLYRGNEKSTSGQQGRWEDVPNYLACQMKSCFLWMWLRTFSMT